MDDPTAPWDYEQHLRDLEALEDVDDYVEHLRLYEGHPQPYCVGCEYHRDHDLRCLPAIAGAPGRRPALSRFSRVQVCSEHGYWEALVSMLCHRTWGVSPTRWLR